MHQLVTQIRTQQWITMIRRVTDSQTTKSENLSILGHGHDLL